MPAYCDKLRRTKPARRPLLQSPDAFVCPTFFPLLP